MNCRKVESFEGSIGEGNIEGRGTGLSKREDRGRLAIAASVIWFPGEKKLLLLFELLSVGSWLTKGRVLVIILQELDSFLRGTSVTRVFHIAEITFVWVAALGIVLAHFVEVVVSIALTTFERVPTTVSSGSEASF